MLCMMGEQKNVKAKLVRANTSPCLVVSFRMSEPPVVWQFDLEKNANFTIVLRDASQGYNLGVTSLEGVFTPVAHFSMRDEAEEAYAAVHKTLMKQGCCSLRHGWARLALIFIVLFLALVLASSLLQREGPAGKRGVTTATVLPADEEASKSRAPVEVKTGVPLPADEVLRPPPN